MDCRNNLSLLAWSDPGHTVYQENTYGTLFTNQTIPVQKFADWDLNVPNIPSLNSYSPWAPWGRQLTYTPNNGMIRLLLSDILNRTL